MQKRGSYSLQDESDQSDGLHSHIVLLIQRHGYNTVLSKQGERAGMSK